MTALAAAVRLLVAALLGAGHAAAGHAPVATPIGRGAGFDLVYRRAGRPRAADRPPALHRVRRAVG